MGMGIRLPAPACLVGWVAVRNKADEHAGKGLADRPVSCARSFGFSVTQKKHARPPLHQRLHRPQSALAGTLQVTIRPLAPHPLQPSSYQNSPILRLEFLPHVSSLFYFHHQCHYSSVFISWFNIMSSVSAGHCSRLLLAIPAPSAPACPWRGTGRTCLDPAHSHTPSLACRPQRGSRASEQGLLPPQGRDSL